MAKYICKNSTCNKTYDYCRGCYILPVPYMKAGFCSKTCQDKFNAGFVVCDEIIEDIKIDLEDDLDTSSFSTKECVREEDMETTLETE